MFQNRLQVQQPIVYQTLYNGLKQNRLAHAYLFVGPNGTPKLQTALLLAQSLICEHGEVFACEDCNECRRIMEGSFADIIILDGSKKSIKKESILELQGQFNKTGLERTGKKIYILNYAENATPEALNSLLKFLEEPGGNDTTAILIVDQVDRLLPTIVSRCQNINFKAISERECYQKCIEEGLDPVDSHILSQLVPDVELISEIANSDEYQSACGLMKQFWHQFEEDPNFALLNLQRHGLISKDKEKDKEIFKYFIEITLLFYQDTIIGTSTELGWWHELCQSANQKGMPIAQLYQSLLQCKDKLVRYPNMSLLIDQMVYQMKEVCQ